MSFLSSLLTWILCLGAPSLDCTNAASIYSDCHESIPTAASLAPPEQPEESVPWGLSSDISNGF